MSKSNRSKQKGAKKLPKPAKKVSMKGREKKDGKQAKKAGGKKKCAKEKEELLKKPPTTLKRRFAGGCSSCRFVAFCTLSCCRKHGFG